MNIIVTSPAGPRAAVLPFLGIRDEIALVKSLLLTLAQERRAGAEKICLSIDLGNVDADRLVNAGRLFSQRCRESAQHDSIRVDPSPIVIEPQPWAASAHAEAMLAVRLLDALERHILDGGAPLLGYAAAQALIHWDAPEVAVQDVCSRIDLAAYQAGLPLLALNWVRKPNGAIDRDAFPLPWQIYRQLWIDRMSIHHWERNHFTCVRQSLQRQPRHVGASELWSEVDAALARPAATTGRRWVDPSGVSGARAPTPSET